MGVRYAGLFEAWELTIARALIREFQMRWWSIAYDPEDDLLQDLLVHWLSVRREFDPRRRRSRNAFMRQVVRNKLFSIVRERETERRSPDYHSLSLEHAQQQRSATSPHDFLDEQMAVLGNGMSDICHREIQIDLAMAVNQLPPSQRRICHLLGGEGLSVNEASRRLRVSRDTVYRELKRIRAAFQQRGFDAYLRP
jgi:RNA polymerase sigma factor (sigma-70 family)